MTPHDASVSVINSIGVRPPLDEGSVGRGELNYAATWDEFPNGRFGDFKSPAYGVQDLWDGGLAIKVCYSLEGKAFRVDCSLARTSSLTMGTSEINSRSNRIFLVLSSFQRRHDAFLFRTSLC